MTLKELQRVFEYCTRPDAPDMYKKLYAEHGAPEKIDSWDDWRALPFLTREYRASIPFFDQSFTEVKNTSIITATSGSSGRGPLFTLVARPLHFMADYWDFKKPFLCFSALHQKIAYTLRNSDTPMQAVIIDTQHLDATARLAKDADIRAIIMRDTQARPLTEALARYGISEQIEFIFCGGTSNTGIFSYLRRAFPHARLVHSYGISDIEGTPVGIPCHVFHAGEAPHFHPSDFIHMELLDERDNVIDLIPGAEGDLLITAWTGENAASPLIRYKNGDRIRIAAACDRRKGIAFEVLGRSDSDFAKVQGGILSTAEIERALRTLTIDVEFQLRYKEVFTDKGPKLHAVLFLDFATNDWDALARTIAAEIRVGPETTYETMVARDYFSPLECARLEYPAHATKLKRLVCEQ